jgi:hypothetical protein
MWHSRSLTRVWFVYMGKYASFLHGSGKPWVQLSPNFNYDLFKVPHLVSHD